METFVVVYLKIDNLYFSRNKNVDSLHIVTQQKFKGYFFIG